ncbi:alpha-1,2-fucosyltransferase [Pseudomonas sp. SWRI18]|uniref:alpha-1,2-fucosyltransferase n=1 Tax=Pseudomonas sp. SWRI18 TaxID=2753888 RepID=UPI0016475DE9|nr:alpha-1,2-fucosyltransferase [Pseudomonas sp. SWRI18]MBC3303295.1 alpha-1,2-fucosyltransferase [Pseudomonas sp. SWRI18]
MTTNKSVMLQGGLGNQLFQLAWAKYAESVLDQSVTCDSKVLLAKSIHGGIRLSDLIDFDHLQFSRRCIFFEQSYLAKAARLISRKMGLRKLGGYLLYDFDAETKFSDALEAVNCRFHFGYFQYVQSALFVRNQLRSLIFDKNAHLIAKGQKLYSHSVGVHVRRGDFLLSTDPRHKVMDESYYLAAIRHFKDREFVIFTDDKAWCEKVFDGQNFKICGLLSADVKPAIADFLSLVCCKDYIIGNSTFAWWAAFLSFTSKPVVYMPRLNISFLLEESNQLIGWDYIMGD